MEWHADSMPANNVVTNRMCNCNEACLIIWLFLIYTLNNQYKHTIKIDHAKNICFGRPFSHQYAIGQYLRYRFKYIDGGIINEN